MGRYSLDVMWDIHYVKCMHVLFLGELCLNSLCVVLSKVAMLMTSSLTSKPSTHRRPSFIAIDESLLLLTSHMNTLGSLLIGERINDDGNSDDSTSSSSGSPFL